MEIDRRALRRKLGTRSTRRRGTKHNGGGPLNERPRMRLARLRGGTEHRRTT